MSAAQMICDLCERPGIHWKRRDSGAPYTKCPHCGGWNCQRPEPGAADPAEAPGARLARSATSAVARLTIARAGAETLRDSVVTGAIDAAIVELTEALGGKP